eukprot:10256986-Alexandrium_andersonii.AAC.1
MPTTSGSELRGALAAWTVDCSLGSLHGKGLTLLSAVRSRPIGAATRLNPEPASIRTPPCRRR